MVQSYRIVKSSGPGMIIPDPIPGPDHKHWRTGGICIGTVGKVKISYLLKGSVHGSSRGSIAGVGIIPNDPDHVQENDLVVISEYGEELLSFLYTGEMAGLSREQVCPPPPFRC
jgi:hypothetical protein